MSCGFVCSLVAVVVVVAFVIDLGQIETGCKCYSQGLVSSYLKSFE